METTEELPCPVAATLEIIGGKWKPLILYSLQSGTRRFGELCVRIPAISRKVLTEQLKEMERDGLIVRQQYKELPPRVEYSNTEMGRALSAVFREMAIFGNRHLVTNGAMPPVETVSGQDRDNSAQGKMM
ncbi:winged helix-turn-helix transcriptional regulator [Mucilaginibacter gossypii]|uniref:DNA-binding transcriptional regulator, HxlR family n=1 Tax=Mucilaginibacter gossypii TaxID=551996 RepID=A0A1G8CQ51_9SPHI|nr:helix-turn-helix domain-containing protein [Mucilaginibacter gossypii]SDH47657.1 DNA-binding transcriptional regulator, HxlR family [Mucilaginibacter gossypii]